jgi:hypothetical protein
VGNGLEAPRSVFVVPPVPPFPRRLAAAVVSSLGSGRPGVVTPAGVGFGSPRAVCGGLFYAAAAELWWPLWAGGGVRARWVLLPLGLGRCRCGSWRAVDLASGRGADMFSGVGAVPAAAVTNHIGTKMGTVRASLPYFSPSVDSPVLDHRLVVRSLMLSHHI